MGIDAVFPKFTINESSSGVSVLNLHDFTLDGNNEILVGREDGSIEMYGYDINNEWENRYSK